VAVSVRILVSISALAAAFAVALTPFGVAPARAASEHVVDIRGRRLRLRQP
jgi:hypothetical protein